MNYNFPKIKTIEDVLPAVEGRDEFVVADREFGTVINYNVNMPDTFNIDENDLMANYGRAIPKGIMRRECRGIIFYPNGEIMSRPFHKFFNVGERDETQPSVLDMSMQHTVMEKLDGSMVRPIYSEGKLRLATKMGLSDVAIQCEKYVFGHFDQEMIADFELMIQSGLTPLFEYVAPGNQIVINYAKPDLVLLAIRDNYTGKYVESPFDHRFSTVLTYGSIKGNLDEYIARQREAEDREGDIIRFYNGHMLKVKNDWYVRIHKVLDRVRFDRNIVDLIINENMDDIMSMMPEPEIERIRNFEEAFWKAFKEKENRLYGLRIHAQQTYDDDRKRIALEMVPNLEYKTDAQFIFRMLDGRDLRSLLLDHITKSIGTNVKWDECAKWMGIEK